MPSMSYCMFQNTTLEMDQILNTLEEAGTLADLKLRGYERDAFFQLAEQCKQFLALAEELDGPAEPEEDDTKYGYIDTDDLV